jgi:hypothetical protein
MDNIICYSLFEQKDQMFDRSGHDPFDKKKYRYWSNIPAIYIVNSLYFNEYKTKFYIHYDLMNHPLYPILDKLSELENFEIEYISLPQNKTSPAYWRLKCLWDKDSKICFSRDSDSIMSPKEVKCMKYFIDSDYCINNIRGIWQHNFESAIIMAGLSGYKSDILRKEMPLPESFNNYLDFCNYNHSNAEWGCDQINGVDFFVKSRSKRLISKILDFYIQPDYKKINKVFWNKVKKSEFFNIISLCENDIKNIDLSYVDNTILNLTESITGWLGEPIDVRGSKLNELLSFNNEKCKQVKSILLQDNNLKQYYKIL